jgi:hypothetical protein
MGTACANTNAECHYVINREQRRVGRIPVDPDASILAAWWGAVVATILLVWDVKKWLGERATLIVNAFGNRRLFSSVSGLRPGELVVVNVTNRGRSPTTINGLAMTWFKSRWRRLRKQTEGSFIVRVETPQPIPHVIQPGEEWSGYFPQTADIDQFSKEGLIELLVYGSHRDKPYRAFVKFDHAGAGGAGDVDPQG